MQYFETSSRSRPFVFYFEILWTHFEKKSCFCYWRLSDSYTLGLSPILIYDMTVYKIIVALLKQWTYLLNLFSNSYVININNLLSHPPLSCLCPLLWPRLPLEVGLLNKARSLGKLCKLPQRHVGRSRSLNGIWCILTFKIWHLVATILIVFLGMNFPKFMQLIKFKQY